MSKITVTYCRVSTNQQEERGSLDQQSKYLQEFAIKGGYNVVATFQDQEHGDRIDRPGLLQLKEYLRLNQMVKYVLVYHSDRFSRDFKDGMKNLFFLEELGIKLISQLEGEVHASGTFDSIPSLVRLISAQEDKTRIVKKTTDAMYNYSQTNRYLGGGVYPWLRLEKVSENGKKYYLMVKNDETWNFYRKVFQDVIKYKNITVAAERNGINKATLSNWLTMPELIGKRSFGKRGRVDKGSYDKKRRESYYVTEERVLPALLNDDEFHMLQSMKGSNKKHYKNDIYVYLYTGLIHCECGSKFFGNNFKSKNKMFRYYRCEKCNKTFNADKLEEILGKSILGDKRLNMINDCDFRISDLVDEIREIKISVEKKNTSEQKILQLIADDYITLETAKKQLDEIRKEKAILLKQVEEKNKAIEFELKKEITDDHIKSLDYLITNITYELRTDLKEIINLIIKKITIRAYDDFQITM